MFNTWLRAEVNSLTVKHYTHVGCISSLHICSLIFRLSMLRTLEQLSLILIISVHFSVM